MFLATNVFDYRRTDITIQTVRPRLATEQSLRAKNGIQKQNSAKFIIHDIQITKTISKPVNGNEP